MRIGPVLPIDWTKVANRWRRKVGSCSKPLCGNPARWMQQRTQGMFVFCDQHKPIR